MKARLAKKVLAKPERYHKHQIEAAKTRIRKRA